MENHHDCGCESARERLDILIDRELSDIECADVRAHCETCESCQIEAALLETLTERFRVACAKPAPEHLRISILKSVTQGTGSDDVV
jgi:anti-sigma factor (TIGR02949 family)